jgi:tetratricopeptide (TPR) repeat protein
VQKTSTIAVLTMLSALSFVPPNCSATAADSSNAGQGKAAAAKDCSDAIDRHSGDDKATQYFNRGVIFENQDQHRQAITDFTKAIAIHPKMSAYYAHRGTSYYGVSDFQHAINDFTRAIDLDSHSSDYYFRRASAFEAAGQQQKALSDFNQAITFDGAKHALPFLKRGELQSELGDHKNALSDMKQAIELSSGDPEYFFVRGLEYETSGDPQKSIADLSNCIAKRPDFAHAYKSRAIARSRIGDKEGALQDLLQSAQLYRQDDDRHQTADINRLIRRLKEPDAKL